jgi:hypothetical protein
VALNLPLSDTIDWLIDRSSKHVLGVLDHLRRSSAKSNELLRFSGAQIEDRSALLKTLGADCEQLAKTHDQSEEAQRVLGEIRSALYQTAAGTNTNALNADTQKLKPQPLVLVR